MQACWQADRLAGWQADRKKLPKVYATVINVEMHLSDNFRQSVSQNLNVCQVQQVHGLGKDIVYTDIHSHFTFHCLAAFLVKKKYE